MDGILFVNFLYIMGIAIFTSTVSQGLSKSYKFGFLSSFHYYVTFLNLFLFAFYTVNGPLNRLISIKINGSIHHVISLSSSFLLFPMMAVSLFLFIKFVAELVDRKVSSTVVTLYFSLSIILFLIFGVFFRSFMRSASDDSQSVSLFIYILLLFLAVSVYYTLYYALVIHRKNVESKRLASVKTIGWYYLIFFSLFLFTFLIGNSEVALNVRVFILITMNIMPLIHLKHFLSMNYIDHFLISEKKINFDGFFEKYKISDREQEVIKLLVQGKSNKDIEEILFISLKTVKNHIYNVYKKAGINSRIQLINLLTKYKK